MYMLYSEKIRDLREYEGIKQVELAEYLGLNRDVYGQFERENTIMPLKYLISISNYFNVSVDYLFSFSEEKYNILSLEVDKIMVGKRLAQFRKENGLTQEKLANYLKTNRSLLSNYEKGIYLISTSFLYMICKKYKISADYLLGRIDEPKYLK